MPQFKREIIFDAKDELQAASVMNAMNILLSQIKDKQHLIELGKAINNKPGLIEKAIPWLPSLKFL